MSTIKPRRRRGRRIAIAVVIVLVGLLVATDFTFAAIAEYQVSKKMRTELKLEDDPSVTIHGFPFVLQALRGDYQDIEVGADGIPIGDTVRDLRVNAHLYDVKVPLSELVSGSARSVVIDRVEGQVKISAADVNRVFDSTDAGKVAGVSNLTIAPAPQDPQVDPGADPATPPSDTSTGVKMAFSVDFAGRQLQISAYGVLTLNGTQIQVQPTKLELTDGVTAVKVPDALQSVVMSMLSKELDLGRALPFTVVPTKVLVDNNAFVVIGRATNVQLSSGRSGLG
ncbi:MAG: DUF2993 domain-containing protein [Kutzneria sp.]|nr:DUF2993 domain-containing protein [Kutzneria sp.]